MRSTPLLLVFSLIAAAMLLAGRNLLSYGADGIQYVQIAREYSAANWSAAINAYWGPLVSWLMVPLIKLGIDPFVSFKIERFFTALACFYMALRFLKRLQLQSRIYYTGIVLVALLPLQWMLHETPDLLFTLLVLIWLELALQLLKNANTPIIAGLVGALLYFTKSFGFPFFLSNLIAVVLLLAWYHRSSASTYKLLYKGSTTLGVFLGISLLWILVISIHYEQPMLGTAGAYNKLMLGPENSSTEIIRTGFVLPTFRGDLEAPATGHLCSWQEPYLSLDLNSWSISEHFQHYALNIFRNISAMAYDDMIFVLSGWVFILLLGLWIFRIQLERKDQFLLALFFLTALNIAAGYVLILVQDRYLWSVEMLLLFAVLLLFDRLSRTTQFAETDRKPMYKSRNGWWQKGVVQRVAGPMFFVAALSVLLVQGIIIRETYSEVNTPGAYFELTKKYPELFTDVSRIAAIGNASPSNYRKAALVSNYVQLPFYGLLSIDKGAIEIKQQLNEYRVDLVIELKAAENHWSDDWELVLNTEESPRVWKRKL